MLTSVFALLAAIIHVYIFLMESFLWGRPSTNRTFRVSPQEAEAGRIWAFNQGFYNLFLAAAVFLGTGAAFARGPSQFSETLIIYACVSMTAAGIVLVISNPKAIGGAIFQSAAPAVALAAWLLNL